MRDQLCDAVPMNFQASDNRFNADKPAVISLPVSGRVPLRAHRVGPFVSHKADRTNIRTVIVKDGITLLQLFEQNSIAVQLATTTRTAPQRSLLNSSRVVPSLTGPPKAQSRPLLAVTCCIGPYPNAVRSLLLMSETSGNDVSDHAAVSLPGSMATASARVHALRVTRTKKPPDQDPSDVSATVVKFTHILCRGVVTLPSKGLKPPKWLPKTKSERPQAAPDQGICAS